MANNKKLKDYFNLGMRKLKHRKGFGVHSPFAFAIITEVIEEKLPYYAYRTMQPLYGKQSPVSYKVATLLLRLANRFKCRTCAELCCDGGYSMLPLMLADSRTRISTIAPAPMQKEVAARLRLFEVNDTRLAFAPTIDALDDTVTYDMLVINGNPFASNGASNAPEQLLDWVKRHTHDDSLIFVSGIQPRQPLEAFWDQLCDDDNVTITMDLYNNGLAILKPRFFKQHYIVSF